VLQHVPDRHEHLVRTHGDYSSRSRGERAQRAAATCATPGSADGLARLDPAIARAARAAWARLIISTRRARTASNGKRQADQMQPDSSPAEEFDFHAVAA